MEDNEYFLTHYKYDFDIDGPIQEFNGSNRLPNFSENKLDDRSNTSSFIYLDGITETVYLSALQVLTLPEQGIFSHFEGEPIVLKDTVQNVQALLPQLTIGQLQSINQNLPGHQQRGELRMQDNQQYF